MATSAFCLPRKEMGCSVRLLVVEDNADLGQSLKQGLELSHYAVDLVADGEDALLMGLTYPYDLVILDILLPGLSGLEVCRRLRQRQCATPILLLTALDAVE